VFIDPAGNSLALFDAAQTPLNVLVDREGHVLWSKTGKPDDLIAVLEPFLP